MRLSLQRLKPAGGLDLATAALITSGVAVIAVALVAGAMLLAPAAAVGPSAVEPDATVPAPAVAGPPSVAVSTDRVATVLRVDAAMGAGAAARSGDRIDVLGYFSRQDIGSESVTRMLLQDVPVLTVDRSGPGVALTLAVPADGALLLQEAQAIGARPFVALRSVGVLPSAEGVPRSYSDTDLANRLAGVR
jgi:Flp pilus assembly protein CpaB